MRTSPTTLSRSCCSRTSPIASRCSGRCARTHQLRAAAAAATATAGCSPVFQAPNSLTLTMQRPAGCGAGGGSLTRVCAVQRHPGARPASAARRSVQSAGGGTAWRAAHAVASCGAGVQPVGLQACECACDRRKVQSRCNAAARGLAWSVWAPTLQGGGCTAGSCTSALAPCNPPASPHAIHCSPRRHGTQLLLATTPQPSGRYACCCSSLRRSTPVGPSAPPIRPSNSV